jgi:LysM repeat protein
LHEVINGLLGKIDLMYVATIQRMAHHWFLPLEGGMPHYCRMAIAIVLASSAFLLSTHAAYAQETGPLRTPLEWPAPEIAPAQNDTVAGTPSDLFHVIAVGDTLSNVAQHYNVEVANLAAYNQILDYNHVVIGQQLRIPPQGVTITAPAAELAAIKPGADGYHVVRQGESLSAIARLYFLTLEELMALNEIDNPNLVRMGTMLRLTADVEPSSHVIQPEVEVVTYTVKRGDTLSEIAQLHATTVEQVMEDNGLLSAQVHVGQELRIYPAAGALAAFGVDAPLDGERKIIIDLSDQSLSAYQGEVRVLYTIVSTGKAETPTRVGEFAIYQKLETQHMTGEDYDLPGVPWVMYYDDEMAMHGAYWHANFGIPTSHGCTNMTIPESKALYAWAPIGTRVIVQE